MLLETVVITPLFDDVIVKYPSAKMCVLCFAKHSWLTVCCSVKLQRGSCDRVSGAVLQPQGPLTLLR